MIGADTQVVIIRSQVTGRDELNQPVRTEVESAPIPGNVYLHSQRELVNGVYTSVQNWYVRLPAGTQISHKDRIRDLGDGQEYEIHQWVNRRMPWGAIWHVECRASRVGE